MLRRAGICVGMAGALLFSLAAPADAGGWWSIIDLEPEYLAIGQTVEVRSTDILFASREAADDAQTGGGFFAYLVRGYDFTVLEKAMTQARPAHWWHLEGARPTLLGTVDIAVTDLNLATASARFVVPDIALGPYALMFCTAGCTEPLADLIPSRVSLVADPQTARLAERVDRLRDQLARVRADLASQASAAEADAHLATVRAGYAIDAARDLHTTIDTLRSDLQLAKDGNRDRSRGLPWAFLGWFVGVGTVLVVLALVRWRRTRPHIDTRELERWMDGASPQTARRD